MGNYICTDGVPFTEDDVRITSGAFPSHRIGNTDNAIPGNTLELVKLFKDFDHNIKAFRFFVEEENSKLNESTSKTSRRASTISESKASKRRASTTSAASGQRPNHNNNNNNNNNSTNNTNNNDVKVASEPVTLSKPLVHLSDTDVYLVIQIHRFLPPSTTATVNYTSGPNGSLTSLPLPTVPRRQKEEDQDRYKGEAPPWSRDMCELFTPRGLSTVVGGDVNRPTPRGGTFHGSFGAAAPAGETSPTDFRFSIHILTGKQSHCLVAAFAFINGLKMEKLLTESPELVRRLFYNCNFGKGESWRRTLATARPSPVGRLTMTGGDGNVDGIGFRLPDFYAKNAVLRNLHGNLKTGFSPRYSSMPSSARYSHGSTPRSARVTSPASFRTSNVFRKEALNSLWNNTSPLPGSSDITQGPPPLEIPTKVRFNTSDTRRNTSSSFVSGRGDRSATATNDGGWESPRVAPFPNITSLRIGDALQDYNSGRKAGFYTNAAGHHGEGTAAGEHPSPPVDRISITREGNIHDDELRHSEERAQRFRLASPEVTEVLPFLFVGGEEAAKDRNQLLKKGITAVVNTVHFDLPNFHSDIINYLSLYVSDSPDEPIFSLIYKVVHYIEEQRKLSGGNGKVFVHCHQGVSRSCSFVIAYVMWHKGMCYDEAYEFVRQRRTICSPNAGFFVTLHLWENLLSNRNNFKLMNNQNMANSLQEVGFNYYVNRGYAYTPYSSKYRFPFSFRVAFSLRDASRLESLLKTTQKYLQVEEDDIIHHPVVRFLKPTDVKLEVDERLCYGFLLQRYPSKDKNKSVSYGTNPVYAFLYCGSKVEKIIADQAKVDWASFIQGNFFPGKEVVESKRKNSEVLRFLPAPPIRGPDSNASDITTFVDTPTLTNEIMNKVYDRPVTANPPSIVVGTKLEWVSALMEHEELTFNFGKMLQSELRSKNEEETKARNREAELRQVLSRERYSVSRDRSQSLPNAHPTSPKVATVKTTNSHYDAHHGLPRSPRAGFAPKKSGSNKKERDSMPDIRTPRSGNPPQVRRQSMTDNSRRPFISAPQSSPPVVAALAVPSPSDSSGRVKSGSITSSRLLAGSYRSNTDLPPSGEPRTGRSARAADEEQAASLLSPRPAAATADSNHSQDDEGILDEFLVVPYPFTGAPDDEILFDDFEEDQAYAAFLPRGEGDVQPCYLWIGSECSLSEAEVLDAYYTNLVTEKGELSNVVRLADNRVVKLVVEEITHEGEEPDALLCL